MINKTIIEFFIVISILAFGISQGIIYNLLGIPAILSIINIVTISIILWIALGLLTKLYFKEE